MENEQLSFGEKRVRAKFNPSDDSTVQHIKERGAEFLNFVKNIQADSSWSDEDKNEFGRWKSLALTDIESGTQWAVKAATTGK